MIGRFLLAMLVGMLLVVYSSLAKGDEETKFVSVPLAELEALKKEHINQQRINQELADENRVLRKLENATNCAVDQLKPCWPRCI